MDIYSASIQNIHPVDHYTHHAFRLYPQSISTPNPGRWGALTWPFSTGSVSALSSRRSGLLPSDPIYEIGCRLGVVHQQEDLFWHGTLKNLATHFGVKTPAVEQQTTCVDSRMQWGEFKNIWYNAAVRTTLDAPVRAFQRFLTRIS